MLGQLPGPVLASILAGMLACLLTPTLRPFLEPESKWKPYLLWVPVGVLAAAAGFGAAKIAGSTAELVAFVAAGVGCALLIVVDLAVRRLPDVLVAVTGAGLLAALAAAAATQDLWSVFGRSVLAAVVLLVGYFLLALIAPAGIGLGDVKFAGVVGVFLGWFGWPSVALGTVLGFTLNGLIALVVLVSRRGGRQTEIPFGPSMVLGAVCAVTLL